MISSQDLRNRITIERKTEIENDDGFNVTVWTTLKTVWAKANGLFGKEYWSAKEYGAENTVIFTIRYKACPDLSVSDRILFNGKTFNIQSIDNVNFMNVELRIKAEVMIK